MDMVYILKFLKCCGIVFIWVDFFKIGFVGFFVIGFFIEGCFLLYVLVDIMIGLL